MPSAPATLRAIPRPWRKLALLLLILCIDLPLASPQKQAKAKKTPAPATIPALFVSDIHFDPFHDPEKATQLSAAPVEQWQAILDLPASTGQSLAFDALQTKCGVRGVDTPEPLLNSSIDALKARSADAAFIIVTGDLLVHNFSCHYTAVLPSQPPGAYQAFVEKTLRYVVLRLHAAYPEIPIYVALGNNDTACGDYRFDPGSAFLSETAAIIADALPPNLRASVLTSFPAGGYYSAPLPHPISNTRIIVLNDVLLSAKYAACSGKPDPAPASAELDWLESQLKEARQHHQHIWIAGHIPPGVDPYSTLSRFKGFCIGLSPTMFLSTDRLSQLIYEYGDVIRLGLFAHTHMDEFRLVAANGDTHPGTPVPIKMVSSISPVNGNQPTFTLASVSPASATLKDYEVDIASNTTGIGTAWSYSYRFSQVYKQPSFSPQSLQTLINQFAADPLVNSPPSKAYLHFYYPGDTKAMRIVLATVWRQYVCALSHLTAKGFNDCICQSGK